MLEEGDLNSKGISTSQGSAGGMSGVINNGTVPLHIHCGGFDEVNHVYT